MIPSYFEFYNPVKIMAGKNALDNLPFELMQLQAKKPLVITDQGILKAGILKSVKKAFSETDITFSLFDRVPQDSSDKIVKELANIYRETKSDSLIALGGGSVIDTAKAVNILITHESDNLLDFVGSDIINLPLKPLIIIPTTSGTGSEATGVAVIKNSINNIKMGFSSQHIIPDVALLDPRMTLTLPPLLTAATGMDALTHAMESSYCSQRNPVTTAFAFSAIKMISEHLVQVIKQPKDSDARFALSTAAFLAGVRLSNSLAGMVHSLGHATGGVCGLPHGIAMNIFLPHGLKYNLAKAGDLIGELLLPLAGSEFFTQVPKVDRPVATIKYIESLRDNLYDLVNLPRSLKEANVPKSEFETIAQYAINDGSIAFNPEEVDYEDALHVLNEAYN
ncbi:alcohol dehydrogenase [Candidatus Heimdallarchaeota archaeon B3_Heim]|nr:MAG: alcohol dehydrogenase [Candidatus Heimdallarchaeota archaeon B3_Heim]